MALHMVGEAVGGVSKLNLIVVDVKSFGRKSIVADTLI